MAARPLVFVTGVSGFIASHIVVGLLEAGYKVRGTARGSKFTALHDTFAANPNFEIIEVSDIASQDLQVALKGVGAIIHAASPLMGSMGPSETLRIAVDGTLNVLRNAVSAGISKVVYLSTLGTALNPALDFAFSGGHIAQSTYSEASARDAMDPTRNSMYVYVTSKILAERAAWDFARAYPSLDLATINPAYVLGPYARGFPEPQKENLGTNGLMYALIAGPPGGPLPPQLPPYTVDVRDVARAHIAALRVQPISGDIQKKRYFIIAGHPLLSDMVKHLAEKRPELQDRLLSTTEISTLPGPLTTYDVTPAKEDLNLTEYIPWETSVLDVVDALLIAEKTW